MRESHTRNFEVDHISDKRTLKPGTVKRITAAVVLDGVTKTVDGAKVVVPREREELDRLAARPAPSAARARLTRRRRDGGLGPEEGDPRGDAPPPTAA